MTTISRNQHLLKCNSISRLIHCYQNPSIQSESNEGNGVELRYLIFLMYANNSKKDKRRTKRTDHTTRTTDQPPFHLLDPGFLFVSAPCWESPRGALNFEDDRISGDLVAISRHKIDEGLDARFGVDKIAVRQITAKVARQNYWTGLK